MAWFRKVKAGLVTQDIANFVGEAGNIFFNVETGELRLSDGITTGGLPIAGGGGGGGDVYKFGLPLDNQIAVWRNGSTVEGDTNLTWNGTNFTITGNLLVNGTVDGRDLSVDGIKLDSIQVGATDDQTGAEITSSLDIYLGSTDWRSGGTGASSVDELTDVDLTGLSDGYILVYDASSLTWKVEANAGGSANSIADLTDVDLVGLSNNDILVYDIATMTWKPEPNIGGSGSTFMPQVDLIDDTNSTYYYFGWVDDGDGWQINRQTRSNALIVRADSINNIAIPDLASAWPLRAGLTYS